MLASSQTLQLERVRLNIRAEHFTAETQMSRRVYAERLNAILLFATPLRTLCVSAVRSY